MGYYDVAGEWREGADPSKATGASLNATSGQWQGLPIQPTLPIAARPAGLDVAGEWRPAAPAYTPIAPPNGRTYDVEHQMWKDPVTETAVWKGPGSSVYRFLVDRTTWDPMAGRYTTESLPGWHAPSQKNSFFNTWGPWLTGAGMVAGPLIAASAPAAAAGGGAGISATGAGLAAGGGSEIGFAGGSAAAAEIANAGISGSLATIPGLAAGAGAGVATPAWGSWLTTGAPATPFNPLSLSPTADMLKSLGTVAIQQNLPSGSSPQAPPMPRQMGPALTQSLAKLQATIAQLRQARAGGATAAGRSTFNAPGGGVGNLATLMRQRAEVNRRLLTVRQARSAA